MNEAPGYSGRFTLLIDEAYRGSVLAGVSNRQLQEFWSLEYPTFPAAAPAPILNKLSAFLAPMSDLERVFSRRENDLDFSAIMDEGRILIVTLSKGVLGDMPSKLLGGCLVACIQNAALARARTPAHRRRDFYLYVDEFQNYTVSSFADILSESAKYRLNLTLAHQNLGQLPEYLRRAIFGNVGTFIAYQLSAQDAPLLAKEMHQSRLVVRRRERNEAVPLSEFVAEKRALYRRAERDPMAGMSRQEQLRFMARYQLPASNPQRAALKHQQAGEELTLRQRHIETALQVFDEPTIDVGALRHLFPDYEFRDLGYPTVEDFVNLPPHHGYVRIGTASNVRPFAPPHPKAPDTRIQRRVLERRWRPAGDDPVTHSPNPLNHDSNARQTLISDDRSDEHDVGADEFIFGGYDDDPSETLPS